MRRTSDGLLMQGSRERVQAISLPSLAGTTVLSATYRLQRFAPHSHPTYVIALIVEGMLAFQCQGKMWHAPAGSVCLINPDEVQTGEAADGGGWSYLSAYIPPEVFEGLSDGQGARSIPDFPDKVVSDPQVRDAALRFFNAARAPSASIGEAERTLESLAYLRSRYERQPERPQSCHEPRLVRIAKEYLAANYADPVSLEDAALAVGVTGFHLTRLFKETTGLPLHAWLVQHRIHRAHEMLRRGGSAVEVAVACGFSDQAHMSRWLRRLSGMTPKEVQAISRSSKIGLAH